MILQNLESAEANPSPGWAFPSASLRLLRLCNIATPQVSQNLWDVPNLLLQKFPGPEFTATTKVTFFPVEFAFQETTVRHFLIRELFD